MSNLSNFLLFMLFVSLGQTMIRSIIDTTRKTAPAPPDPIEIEARRLAEIEIDEFCKLIAGELEPNPVPIGSIGTLEGNTTLIYGSPVEKYSDAHSVMPLIIRGPKEVTKEQAIRAKAKWLERNECFCMDCNRWTDHTEDHYHVRNMFGETVFTYPA